MKKMIAVMWMLALALGTTSVKAEEEVKNACTSKAQVRIATGKANQTYSQEIQVVGAVRPDLVCENRDSTGGPDNMGLLMQRKVDAAMVMVDVAEALKNTDPRIEKSVRSLMTLHGNSMHIYVKKNGTPTNVVVPRKYLKDKVEVRNVVIRNVRDLQRRKVAIIGGALITGMNMNDALKLGIIFDEVKKPEEGFAKLLKNEVHAFIALGGWPISWAQDPKTTDWTQIKMAMVDQNDVKAIGKGYYYPGKITYNNIGVIGLPTLFVRNEMLVWNYPSGERAERLVELRNFLRENIDNFANDVDSLPAWGDFDKTIKTNWPRYSPKITKKK